MRLNGRDGVKIRQRYKCQNFAGLDVQDEPASTCRLVLHHGPGEFIMDGVLDPQIDRCLNRGKPASAAQSEIAKLEIPLRVYPSLQPRRAEVVDVRQTDDVCRGAARGIEAPDLGPEPDTRNTKRHDPVMHLRREVTLQPDETTVPRKPGVQVPHI